MFTNFSDQKKQEKRMQTRMQTPTKFILFCGQEANFQTRSMLIPYDLAQQSPEFVADLKLLREASQNNVAFNIRGQKWEVDQLLNIVLEPHEYGYAYQRSAVSAIIHKLMYCADSGECRNESQAIWADEMLCGVASNGFNHVTNYCSFRKKTTYKDRPIEIVEGFLALELREGEYEIPRFDTVQEMLDELYPNEAPLHRALHEDREDDQENDIAPRQVHILPPLDENGFPQFSDLGDSKGYVKPYGPSTKADTFFEEAAKHSLATAWDDEED